MSLLPFSDLKPYRPRRVVPAEVDLGDWSQVSPVFDALESQAKEATDLAALEQWLLDWGELSAAIDEESSKRYIAMTCHTDSEEAEKSYLQFVEQIEPQLKPRQFALSKIYMDHPLRSELPEDRYHVFDRDVAVHVELFREENVPLETEESRHTQQYQKLSGSLTVNFRGEEMTLVQMARFQEETDRQLREEAWEASARRRLREGDKFEKQFDELFALRAKIAKNAGFENYRDFVFRERGRFDYTPEDCEAFHTAVEKCIVPLLKDIQKRRKESMKLDSLRPWDGAVDPFGRGPLRPFKEVDDMVTRTQKIFDNLDPTLAGWFQEMQDKKLLDLGNRKGKAPGGYQCGLEESRLPFIFMNAVGVQRDVETLLHEAGHAFHSMASREEDLTSYRHAPLEFCEVASMAMELLGGEFLNEFYSEDEANRARQTHLEGIITIFPWIATVDAFQHWLYTHPDHTPTDRKEAWTALMKRFGGDVDWAGHEDVRDYLWHRQLHIFIHPFYYIEYGIAQLGALQVWANSLKDKAGALESYQKALSLGGSRPLPELFSAAGGHFDFSEATVAPLMELVGRELAKLDANH